MTLLVFLSFVSFFGYIFTNRRKSRYSFKTFLDSYINVMPVFVIPYVLLYPLVVYSYLSLSGITLDLYLIAIFLANIIATVFWYLFPNGVVRGRLNGSSIFSRVINYIYSVDGDTNGFPSGHVFLSVISCYFLYASSNNLLYIVLALLISVSTVFTKQHYVVDIIGGLVVAGISIAGSGILMSHFS